MKLRTIYLSLYGYPDEISDPFSFETRCLCNFVQRPARKMKIDTEGFNNIVVCGDPSPDAAVRLVHEKSLSVPFIPDLERYKMATDDEKHRYFIEILTEGLHRANEFHPLPIPALLELIREYEDGKYRNCWIHQTKLLRGHGLRATLMCELTMHEFSLTLSVSRKEKILMSENILSTKPDEICFHYMFKDILLCDNNLVVTARRGFDNLAQIPLSRFEGEVGEGAV